MTPGKATLRRCPRRDEHLEHMWASGAVRMVYCDGRTGLQQAADLAAAVDAIGQAVTHKVAGRAEGEHERPADHPMLSDDLIEALIEQGACPADTRRVVIDASMNHMVTLYTETTATAGLLEVLRAVSRAAVHVKHPTTEQPTTEETDK